MKTTTRENCAARLFGAWACEPKWLSRAVAAVKAGTWAPNKSNDDQTEPPPYEIGGKNGDLALIPISDQITKGRSSFGGTSSIAVRRAVRAAADDDRVRAIFLLVSSPGGTVAGTGDLADDIAAVNVTKPVFAHLEDVAASAAYWIVSGARRIFAAPSTLVGSVGTYAVLEDSTGAQEIAGVKLTVISSAEYKGLGADGKVSEALVGDVKREIASLNSIFLGAVSRGRRLAGAALDRVATGKVWIASEARSMGLVDRVCGIDDAMSEIDAILKSPPAVTSPAFPTMPPPPATPMPSPDPDEAAQRKATEAAEKLDDAGLFAMWKTGTETEKIIAAITRAKKAGCAADVIEAAWKVASTSWETDAEELGTGTGRGAKTSALSPVAFSDNVKAKPMTSEEAKIAAKNEWDSMTEEARADWASEEVFIATRTMDLCGRARIHGRKTGVTPLSGGVERDAPRSPASSSITTPAAPAPVDPASIEEPKARAEAEWAGNVLDCHGRYANEAAYVAVRVAGLNGRVTISNYRCEKGQIKSGARK